MTEHDRLTEVLRSMQPAVSTASTEQALADVHDRSHRRLRHQRLVRGAISAAAAILLIGGAVVVANLGNSGDEAVIADQTEVPRPTATTTAVEDWTSSTIETTTTTTPDRLTADELDGVVGIELHTWWMGGEDPTAWNGLWSAEPNLVNAVVEALREPGPAVAAPEWPDHATIRFERSDGTYLFRRIDVESGWVEPDQQLPEDLARQLRNGLNEAVATPWREVDLSDPNSYLGPVFAGVFPIRDLEGVAAALDQAREAHPEAHYGHWFFYVVREGHGPIVEIRLRGMGDDSSRGSDVRVSLVETPDGWDIGGAMARALCVRSTPIKVEGSDDPVCV